MPKPFFKLTQWILCAEAARLRRRMTGPVIAIAGSVGKTGTKDAIGLMAKQAFGAEACFITPKSLNAELGVPLTLLGFQDLPHGLGWLSVITQGALMSLFGIAPKCMVVELGEENPGDLALFTRLVRPTHLVLTDISEAHSVYLGDLKAIEREILSVVPFLADTGVLLVNGDNPVLAGIKVRPTQTKVSVRFNERADYFASGIRVALAGTSAIIHHSNRTQKVTIKRWGAQHIYAVLFMAAIGDALGVTPSHQLQAFKALRPGVGRGQLIAGQKGSVLFDESYNAQPAAMQAALETLHAFSGKKIAILGDMRELADPVPHHRAIGRLARDVADYVIAVGPNSQNYGANEWFLTANEAIPSALRQLSPGAIVLIKGSQNTIRLERVVKALMLHPEEAPRLLARQDPHWLKTP